MKKNRYMTMPDKSAFLSNMKDILVAYCDKIRIDLSPSQSNVSPSPLYLEGRGGPSETALQKAGDNIQKYAQVITRKGPDGNHHKMGKAVRKKANYIYDAADALTEVNENYMQELRQTADFIIVMKGMTPKDIALATENIIFSSDVKKLTI